MLVENFNIFDQNYPKLPRNPPKWAPMAPARTSMLTDQAVLVYNAMTANRQLYVRTYVRTYETLYVRYEGIPQGGRDPLTGGIP